jgi:hypothetical protein
MNAHVAFEKRPLRLRHDRFPATGGRQIGMHYRHACAFSSMVTGKGDEAIATDRLGMRIADGVAPKGCGEGHGL